MLHIRVLSNDEWKASPPTRGAIKNRAGSEISIIASGYYVHRMPLFSVSRSYRHRHFRDITISCRRCIRERENNLSIMARTSSRSTSRALVICITPGMQSIWLKITFSRVVNLTIKSRERKFLINCNLYNLYICIINLMNILH